MAGSSADRGDASRGALSLAVFLHEVGHHVIGFDRYKQRCEEEYHVWAGPWKKCDGWGSSQMHASWIAFSARCSLREQGDAARIEAGA